MKALHPFFLFLIACSPLFSQSSYQASYSFDHYHSSGDDIILDGDDQVFTSSHIYKNDQSYFPYDTPLSLVSVTKTDQHGNVLWNKGLDNGYELAESRIVNTQDGHYAVAANFQYKTEYQDFQAISITKLDDQGQQVWSKSYGPGMVLSMKVKTNGNLLILSYFESSSWMESPPATYQLTEMDGSGYIVNYQFITTPNSLVCFGEGSIEVLNDNSVVFATGSVEGQLFVSKYDPQLNSMWSRMIEVRDHTIFTPILASTENRDIVIGADLEEGNQMKTLALVTLTEQGNLTANPAKIFSKDGSELYIKDFQYEQGTFYFSGWDHHPDANQWGFNPVNSVMSPFRVMIGNSTTSGVRFYNSMGMHPDHLSKSDVVSGQWVSVGGYEPSYDVWVARSQNMASTECVEAEIEVAIESIEPMVTELEEEPVNLDYLTLSVPMEDFDMPIHKTYCPLLYVEEIKKPNDVSSTSAPSVHSATKAYPNPSHGQLTVELSDRFNPEETVSISIHNVLGQQVRSLETTNRKLNLHLTDLPHGQYIMIARQNAVSDQVKIYLGQ